MTLPEWGVKKKTVPYKRNQNTLPADLEEYFAYFAEWKKMWNGANLCYEYHFWRHQAFDLSGIELAKREEFAGKNIVMLLPDGGAKYLSTKLFQD